MTSVVEIVIKRTEDVKICTPLLTSEVDKPIKIRVDAFTENEFNDFLEEVKGVTGLQLIVVKTQVGSSKFNWGRDYKCNYSTGTIR